MEQVRRVVAVLDLNQQSPRGHRFAHRHRLSAGCHSHRGVIDLGPGSGQFLVGHADGERGS
jgi:hypothetical protein